MESADGINGLQTMRKLLCDDQLSIWLQDDHLQIKLGDRLELNYPVSTNTPSRRYHIREAAVIAMRRLIAQAVQEGLIDLPASGYLSTSNSPGGSWTSTHACGPRSALGVDITLSIEPDA